LKINPENQERKLDLRVWRKHVFFFAFFGQSETNDFCMRIFSNHQFDELPSPNKNIIFGSGKNGIPVKTRNSHPR